MYSINNKIDGVSVFITEDKKKRETVLFSELLIQHDCLSTISRLMRTYDVPAKAILECINTSASHFREKDRTSFKAFLSNASAFRNTYNTTKTINSRINDWLTDRIVRFQGKYPTLLHISYDR